MNISKDDLTELLSVATKHQLFQFNGNLYKKVDGIAMGSPLRQLMANVLCVQLKRNEHVRTSFLVFIKDT